MTNSASLEQGTLNLTQLSDPHVLTFYQRLCNLQGIAASGQKIAWDKIHQEVTGIIDKFTKSARTDDDYRLLAQLCAMHDDINKKTGYKIRSTYTYYNSLQWFDKVRNKTPYDFNECIKWGFLVLQRYVAITDPKYSRSIRTKIVWIRDRMNFPAIVSANASNRLEEVNKLLEAVEQNLKKLYVSDSKYLQADHDAETEFKKIVTEVTTNRNLSIPLFHQMLKIVTNVIDPELARRLHIEIARMVLKVVSKDNIDRRLLAEMLLSCSRDINCYNKDYAELVLSLLKEALKMAISIPHDRRMREDNDAISQAINLLVTLASLNPPNVEIQRQAAILLNSFYDAYLKLLPTVPLTEWSIIRGSEIEYPINAIKNLLAMYGWLNAITSKRDDDYRLMQQICGKGANLCSRYLNMGNEREWIRDGIRCFDGIKTKVTSDYKNIAYLWLRYGDLHDVEDKTKYFSIVIDYLQHIPEAERTTEDRANIEKCCKANKEFLAKREQAERKAQEETKAKEKAKEKEKAGNNDVVSMETDSEQRNSKGQTGESEHPSRRIFNVSRTSFT